jgi:signal transduction histidine kinase
MEEECIVTLPGQWVAADNFENALLAVWNHLTAPPPECRHITFRFPPSCKIMVDAAVRLLSLANQLIAAGTSVAFAFEGENHEAMGYLHRANFFTVLSPQVQVIPHRPNPQTAARHRGNNPNLVEFEAIHRVHDAIIESIPTRLTDALGKATANRADKTLLERAALTIFGELINNVEQHSQTELDGFAALQVYQQGGKVQIVVSDSGVGLLETLRPKLLSPAAQHMEDAQIIRLLFQGNLQWKHGGTGQGLHGCAYHALKFHGNVDIRLDTCSIHLRPSAGSYNSTSPRYRQNLVSLQGTHICFTFPLDNPS